MLDGNSRGVAHAKKDQEADNSGNSGFMHLAAGLSVGLSGVAAGYTIGIVGDAV